MEWPSGQWQQTVNLSTGVYHGSNPCSTTNADLAQPAEHIHGKDGVFGSNPKIGSIVENNSPEVLIALGLFASLPHKILTQILICNHEQEYLLDIYGTVLRALFRSKRRSVVVYIYANFDLPLRLVYNSLHKSHNNYSYVIMNKNIYLIFMGLFFALCLALSGGVWLSLHELENLREEYDLLESERTSSVTMMQSMQNRHLDLTEITGLNIDNAGSAHDAVEFYSHVRQAIEDNKMELVSMNSDSNNDSILNLQVEGSYYSFAHLLAAWRQMPFACRINSLKLKRDANSPMSKISAQIVLEAMMEEE